MTRRILPRSIERLAQALSSLPGIGPKTANRLTFYLLGRTPEELSEFGEALSTLKDQLTTCGVCQIISETDPCDICQDKQRDSSLLAVVEETLDVLALEKTRFQGVYHVLGGQISPINDIGPEQLKIKELLNRLEKSRFQEVILATDPSLEGEATALYLDEQISVSQKTKKINRDLLVTRLARGLPVGGDLEYADELTLGRALEGRRAYADSKS